MSGDGGLHSLFQESVVHEDLCDWERYSGVRALWVKVIIRAAYEWVSWRDSFKLQERKVAESAYVWLFEPSTLFNGLENVCFFLGILPDQVRYWARSLSKDQITKIEYIDREGDKSASDLLLGSGQPSGEMSEGA